MINLNSIIFNASNTQESKITDWHVILIFFAFLVAVILASMFKKIYYRIWLKKKYFVIPRPGIKGIANVSMVVALSVAVLILMTIITSNLFSVLFRAFPGTRVTIESILIKIGGLLFGPFLGLFIGMLTDLLSVLMTAGIFHPGYFIAALCCGLLSGLIRTIVTFSSKNKLKFAIYSTIALALTALVTYFYLYNFIAQEGLKLEFGIQAEIPKNIAIFILCGFSILTIAIIWVFYFITLRKDLLIKREEKNKLFSFSDKDFILLEKMNKQKKSKKSDKFIIFCASITCVVMTEMIINVQAMPFFDAKVTTIKAEQWLAIRSSLYIPMVIFNMLIIYPVSVIVSPLVSYNYESELSEDLSIKIENN